MTVYWILSLLSGAMELGSLFYAYLEGYPMYNLLLFPLAYQLGNLFPIPFALGRKGLRVIYSLYVFSVIVCLAVRGFGAEYGLTLLAPVFLGSVCIQSSRSLHKCSSSRMKKRLFRIAGFGGAALFAVFPASILLLTAVLLAISLRGYPIKTNRISPVQKFGTVSLTMVLHQFHYFVYTYAIPVYVAQVTGQWLLGVVLFVLTWLTYLLPDCIFKLLGSYIGHRRFFYLAHGFLVLVMLGLCISLTENRFLLCCVFYLLTGLGGGSVFCIPKLSSVSDLPGETSILLAENIGHVGGILLALAVSYCIAAPVPVLTLLSMLFVILTLIFGRLTCRKAGSL